MRPSLYLRVFIQLFLAVSASSTALAQSSSFNCSNKKWDSPAAAKVIVEKIQSAYRNVISLRAEFRQEAYLAALDMSEKSSGNVWFKRPGKMKWLYLEPEPQTFVLRNETLWLYQQQENQVIIDDVKNVLLSDLPVSFIMGIGDLARDFEVVGSCKGADGLLVNLAPHGSQKSDKSADGKEGLAGFILLVDSGTYLPKGAKVTDVGGNVTSILIENVSASGAADSIKDNEFEVSFPKGADVVDRRNDGQETQAPQGEK